MAHIDAGNASQVLHPSDKIVDEACLVSWVPHDCRHLRPVVTEAGAKVSLGQGETVIAI